MPPINTEIRKNWTFFIITFGCKVNQHESRLIYEAWQNAGGTPVEVLEEADYIIINSCAITSRAEQDMRHAVISARKKNPAGIIIVSGCGAQFHQSFIPRKNANYAFVDYYIPQKKKHILYNGPHILQNVDLTDKDTQIEPILTSYNRARPIIKVQDGCSRFCAYCIVPYTRGMPQSRSYEDILNECILLCQKGYGELVISGINLMQYAGEGDFWTLIAKLDRELYKKFGRTVRLRISSIDAGMINSDTIKILKNTHIICHHLHLSIQHASPSILSAMRRKTYNAESIRQSIFELQEVWDVFGLGADFLIGFPGETIPDHKILEKFIDEMPFTYGHVFPFSARPGTQAAKMPNQLPKSEKNARAAIIRTMLNLKQNDFWQRQALREEMEIVSYIDNSGTIRGINEYYVPCLLDCDIKTHKLIYVRPNGLNKDGIKAIQINK